MKTKDRVFIAFSLFFWAVFLFSLTGIVWFFALSVIGILYAFLGGKRHD
jgi:hypothetical protein